MTDRISANELLDMQGAQALADGLRARRGQPVTVDLSRVRHAGAAALQVMLAAREAWQSDGVDFAVHEPSEALQQSFALMGADPELLDHRGA
ncbi:STAS domain-containing protein [Mesobaculum littorinae]|uniref:STAS domain-containing protein n=1 Tax=Mesobaculum littorinae TaxID=2486419 RepID=A0A438AKV9_9RHOB|nr:STAS domain-containing protein [Mesobaculum littorinae]RVV99245.1 STAS domain-containing protein [Mesobaculum littorinae]